VNHGGITVRAKGKKNYNKRVSGGKITVCESLLKKVEVRFESRFSAVRALREAAKLPKAYKLN
jgi:hypothetical protein